MTAEREALQYLAACLSMANSERFSETEIGKLLP
jgi:hypothetical protein